MIRNEDVARIMDAVRIEEVIGDFVLLKKEGANMVGLCPFHNEKTPSFKVSLAKGIFKCFGCGKGGDAVSFMMEHEHYSYPEALRYLARKYGIDIVEKQASEEEVLQRGEEEKSYFIHEFAKQWFFEQCWNTPEGQSIALNYFRERGFGDATIKKFQLGYSPKAYDSFTKHAKIKGYTEESLIKNGLTLEKNKNDRFHSRVIFPIHSESGRVLAFGGRTMQSDKKIPKYLNSPETLIYHKSKILYGLFFAKNAIIKKDLCYLTEGYTDVISLYQAGVENVVSSSGTSLTIGQIKRIQRYTFNITVLYDGDAAGLKASFRAIDMILAEGMNVRIVLFPEGEDPDSFAQSHSSKELQAYLDENNANFIMFKAETLLKEAAKDPVNRSKAIKDIVGSIAEVSDQITRAEFIKECSLKFELSEKILISEMNNILREKRRKFRHAEAVDIDLPEEKKETQTLLTNTSELLHKAEKNLLQLIINDGNVLLQYIEKNEEDIEVEKSIATAEFVFSQLAEENIVFKDKTHLIIFDICKSQFEKNNSINSNQIMHVLPPELKPFIVDLSLTPYLLSPNWEKRHNVLVKHKDNNKQVFMALVDSSVLGYKQLLVRYRIDEVVEKLKENKGVQEQDDLLMEYAKLKKLEIKINKEQLNRVIIK